MNIYKRRIVIFLLTAAIIQGCKKVEKMTINNITGTYVGKFHFVATNTLYNVDTIYAADTFTVVKVSEDSFHLQMATHIGTMLAGYHYNTSNSYNDSSGFVTVKTIFYPANDSLYYKYDYFTGFSSTGGDRRTYSFTGKKIK